MLNKPLSDEEVEVLVGKFAGGDAQGLVTYVNRLLDKRCQGLDSCARPLSFRQDDEVKDTCFAKGYLVKVKDLTQAASIRVSDQYDLSDRVSVYIDELIKEINTFFV